MRTTRFSETEIVYAVKKEATGAQGLDTGLQMQTTPLSPGLDR